MKIPLKPKLIFISMLAVVCFSLQCLNLDPFLFEGEALESYKFDFYGGERELDDVIDSLGLIRPEKIHELTLQSGSDSIAAILLGPQSYFTSEDTVILYLHGNTKHLDYYWPKIRLLYESGYPVFAIDYRGFGRSSGVATEENIYEDGHTALSYLKNHGNPQIVVIAYSLGSLIGGKITSHNPYESIIALSFIAPIGSIETLVKDALYFDVPGSYVTTFRGNNMERIKQIDIPFLWLHGTEDETLALETNGLPIWENYTGREGFAAIIENAAHTDIPSVVGYSKFIEWIRAFISGEGKMVVDFEQK
ncbi:alpha/beta fold hydrolase [Chitinispirillales bacterium ANBcel5]|uniref:alpha/beta hydrolase n=1 Tax=Cellulosispirillum alkaliphilum TaxID=3039283 RepID=UPI002A532F88|nr:alpha/beta fold hydrolase [Chitinispirillales bacterium ANBcel5]